MKKLIIISLLALISISSKAQSYNFGTITADAGLGFGTYYIYAYSPVNEDEHFGIGLVGTAPAINADFGLTKFLGVGMRYRRGTYGKTSVSSLRGNDLMLRLNFHLANRSDKFDLPLGIGYGITSFGGDITNKEYIRTNGSIIHFHVSPHFYFHKYVGMYLSLGWNQHLLSRKIEMRDETGKIWTEKDGATWSMGGLFFEFGVAGKFGIFDK